MNLSRLHVERIANLVLHRRLAFVIERDGALFYQSDERSRMLVPALTRANREIHADQRGGVARVVDEIFLS